MPFNHLFNAFIFHFSNKMSRPHGLLYAIKLSNFGNLKQKLRDASLYLQWKRRYAPKLAAFKGKHAGEDCFIIGNGPSLNKMDLSPLKNYHTFGLNKIYLLFDKYDLNLSYLAATNALVIEQSKEKYEQNFPCPIFLSHTASAGVIDDRPNIHRLHTLNTWSFYDDLTQPICEGWTVTYVAMQIAYFMGFKRIFLIGVDHSFKQSGKSNETQTYQGDDQNHFDPNYFKGQQWQLADVEGSEVSYNMANYFYRKDNRQIFDATLGGKLEVFPKITFEEAIKVAKKKI
jgi:hypothetical protein